MLNLNKSLQDLNAVPFFVQHTSGTWGISQHKSSRYNGYVESWLTKRMWAGKNCFCLTAQSHSPNASKDAPLRLDCT